jgi:nitric oxide reductase NorQ protein
MATKFIFTALRNTAGGSDKIWIAAHNLDAGEWFSLWGKTPAMTSTGGQAKSWGRAKFSVTISAVGKKMTSGYHCAAQWSATIEHSDLTSSAGRLEVARDLRRQPLGVSTDKIGVESEMRRLFADLAAGTIGATATAATATAATASPVLDPSPDPDDTTDLPARTPRKRMKRLAETSETFTRPNGQTYLARTVGPHQDIALFRAAQRAGHNVLLRSAPGTGKTAALEAAFGTDMEVFVGSVGTEESHLIGRHMPDVGNPGAFRWADGPLTRAARRGVPFFYDEIARVDPAVNAVLYPMMDGSNRLIIEDNDEIVTPAEGFCVVAAYNPDVPGAFIDEPLLARFHIQIEYTTDWTTAVTLGVDETFIEVARAIESQARNAATSLRWSPQMREALNWKSLAEVYGEPFAWGAMIAAVPELDRPDVAAIVKSKLGGASKIAELRTTEAAI